jgi:hypothetical protein
VAIGIILLSAGFRQRSSWKAPEVPHCAYEAHHAIALYSQGIWSAIQSVRTSEFISRHFDSLFVLVPFVFPRFPFGLWLWRSGFIQNIGFCSACARKM